MNLSRVRQRAAHSWLFLGALFVLGGLLGFLQYRWTGEVSVAERERLRASLRSSLFRLSVDFNAEVAAACRSITPHEAQPSASETESEIAARFAEWKKTTRHERLFSRIVLAVPGNGGFELRELNLEQGTFGPAEWPPEWADLKQRLHWQMPAGRGQFRDFSRPHGNDPLTVELPLFAMPRPGGPGRFFQREPHWLILELNLQTLRDSVLPDLLERHLNTADDPDYDVVITTRTVPPAVIYQSDPGRTAQEVTAAADASVPLLDLWAEQFRRGAPGPRGAQAFGRRPGFGGRGRGMGMVDGFARWEMYVRHRAGSLEAVVSRARWRNLAVTAGLLMLMGAAAVALARYTRRAQRLAEQQIGFVAGVSHELRTPLTVIHTAAYNLRGKVAASPGHVERYGALIQQESGRLRSLVEQILDFAGTEAGYVVKEPEPVSVETVIDEVLDSAKTLIETHNCEVEKQIEPGLPAVPGDRVGLRHALANVVSNAAKYGSKGGNWIGVFASKIEKRNQVEIRIADRGPGIPADEQEQIFEPFFRGRMAVENQVHGTGLGLNLAKKIVEAHGGSIQVKSELMKGTVFTIRLPAAPDGRQP